MRRNMNTLMAMCMAVVCLGGVADALEVKLNVTEMWDKPGKRYVTCGVPLLPGQAIDVGDLRLAVKDGRRLRAVPAQFRSLARWWSLGHCLKGNCSLKRALRHRLKSIHFGSRSKTQA